MSPVRRKWILLATPIFIAWGLIAAFAPTAAQDSAVTPAAPPLIFATNTPQPPPLAVIDAPIDRYALRLWDENSFVQTLLVQIRQLQPNRLDGQIGARLMLNELQQRFPGAPHDAALREEMVQTLLRAPRGSVDLRPIIRPYIQAKLNELRPSFDDTQSLTDIPGFLVNVTPAKLDSRGGHYAVVLVQDAGSSASPDETPQPGKIYSDVLPAALDSQGAYRLLDTTLTIPAGAYGTIQRVQPLQLGDVNNDGLEEIGVAVVYNDDPNTELLLYNWRGGIIASLVQPGQHVRFVEMLSQPGDGTLNVREVRVESAAWGCLGQRDVSWTWSGNLFRPPELLDNFTFQNRLACLLYGAEPLFEKPLAESINSIEQIVPFATPEDQDAMQRAAMMLVMMRVLNGDISQALEQVQPLQSAAQPGSWLAQQTRAFSEAAATAGTPLQLCAALQKASQYGACDVNQVLTRIFKEQPFSVNEPIADQAARLGMTVRDRATVASVGRVNREALLFDLAGQQWWGFAVIKGDTYTAEEIDPPPGHEFAQAPTLLVTPPQKAYDALLIAHNPKETLSILDNIIHDNPDAMLDGSARFLQALCYDLLSIRANARNAYFALWSSEPESVWGQLAAAHLERR